MKKTIVVVVTWFLAWGMVLVPAANAGHESYMDDALLGGATGALIGLGLSRDGNEKEAAVRGALLGAGAGLGLEYLRRDGGRYYHPHHHHHKHKHKCWKRHPLFDD